jgi:hypothetical protein
MVEVLKVGLVHGVPNDFNVKIVEVCCGETVAEVRSWELQKRLEETVYASNAYTHQGVFPQAHSGTTPPHS